MDGVVQRELGLGRRCVGPPLTLLSRRAADSMIHKPAAHVPANRETIGGMAPPHEPQPATSASPFKSRAGLDRLWRAAGYSWAGLRAALRHEAAFRQELAVGLPLVALAWLIAPGRWQALAMTAVIFFVFVVELLNSAIEALADAVSVDTHPLLGRAKDLGSAAVMGSIGIAVLTWLVALWP